jgi:hypothetical protein
MLWILLLIRRQLDNFVVKEWEIDVEIDDVF